MGAPQGPHGCAPAAPSFVLKMKVVLSMVSETWTGVRRCRVSCLPLTWGLRAAQGELGGRVGLADVTVGPWACPWGSYSPEAGSAGRGHSFLRSRETNALKCPCGSLSEIP